MNNDLLVSVVTPTYNRADLLPFAIESVLGQTYENFELLIVDDGSTDNTKEIVDKYLSDSRVRYFYQENSGQSVARNVGLKEAIGSFICFLDSDNLWKLDKLEFQIKFMSENLDVDVLYGNCELIDEDGQVIGKTTMAGYSGNIMEQMLVDNYVRFNTTITRRKCFNGLGGFDSNLKRADDYDLWLRFSAEYKFFYMKKDFAEYRIMDNQISSNKDGRFEANKFILEKFIKNNRNLVGQSLINNTWCRFYVRRGRYRASVGRLLEAFKDYLFGIKHSPFSIHPWRALLKLVLLRR